MKKLKAILTLALIFFVVLSVVSIGLYADYKIYKAKYPNTEMWMFILDSK